MRKISVKNSLYKKIWEVARGEGLTVSQALERMIFFNEKKQVKNEMESGAKNEQESKGRSEEQVRLEFIGRACVVLSKLPFEELNALVVSYTEAYPKLFGEKNS